MLILEQGDCLFFNEKLPADALKKEFDGVVEYGEATGHCHKLDFNKVEYFETPQKTRYLRVLEPVDLCHEEHKPITIQPGDYRVGRVLEYDHFEEEAKGVMD